ncbi:MAG: NADH-quinone oxidoreductase subunit J [Acidobacteria bacterium]|nr:NADH-quinone oxidoreductase subunit J [Acidobacteriota bacterium]
MDILFYVAAVVAVLATALAITRRNAVHGLLYLIVSLLAVALIFFVVGAPFVAALEVIIYAGAIMVLFVFVMMLLNLGPQSADQERRWLPPGVWSGPLALAIVLFGELLYVIGSATLASTGAEIGPVEVGIALYGPYALGVEIASMLLLAGLVGAYHLGRRETERSGGG